MSFGKSLLRSFVCIIIPCLMLVGFGMVIDLNPANGVRASLSVGMLLLLIGLALGWTVLDSARGANETTILVMLMAISLAGWMYIFNTFAIT